MMSFFNFILEREIDKYFQNCQTFIFVNFKKSKWFILPTTYSFMNFMRKIVKIPSIESTLLETLSKRQ